LADGGVDVRPINGDHAGILREPALKRLADALEDALSSGRTP